MTFETDSTSSAVVARRIRVRIRDAEPEFQLQILEGRDFVTVNAGPRKSLEAPFEALAGVSRRIVRTDKARAARPAYRRPPMTRASDREREAIIAEYMEWAKARGLASVAVYVGGHFAVVLARGYDIEPRPVDPAEHLQDRRRSPNRITT
jgi:hypothetical protein